MHRLYCEEKDINYGQKYLLDLCDKRQLNQFWQKNCLDQFDFTYIFCIATGKQKSASLAFINLLSRFINPADWFYTLSEPKPQELPDNVRLTDNIRLSKNFSFIQKMYENKELYSFCKEKNISYKALMHVLTGRNLISYPKIKELKEIFKPIDWFILDENNL